MLNSSLKYFNNLLENPKRVFLIDALGALLTTVSIAIVLVQFQQFIGLPIKTLQQLSIGASFLFVYSILCSFLVKLNWKPFLVLIIVFNITYSIVSLSVIINSETITNLGCFYFILEVIVIALVVLIEVKTLLKQRN